MEHHSKRRGGINTDESPRIIEIALRIIGITIKAAQIGRIILVSPTARPR
jgi:hypothetical protein